MNVKNLVIEIISLNSNLFKPFQTIFSREAFSTKKNTYIYIYFKKKIVLTKKSKVSDQINKVLEIVCEIT